MKQSVKFIILFLSLMWFTYFVSLVLPVKQFGLVPRTLEGLIGIFSAPFLHGSLQHLIENSISFLIFSMALALLEGKAMLAKVILMLVIGGSLTWLFAGNANHIGVSGLIFSFWGYMLLSGWFTRKIIYIVVSVSLMFFYSGMIFGVLPGKVGVSWEGHLYGFIAGVIVAWLYYKKTIKS